MQRQTVIKINRCLTETTRSNDSALFRFNHNISGSEESAAPLPPANPGNAKADENLVKTVQFLISLTEREHTVHAALLFRAVNALDEASTVSRRDAGVLLSYTGDKLATVHPNKRHRVMKQVWKNIIKKLPVSVDLFNRRLAALNQNGRGFNPTHELANMLNLYSLKPDARTYKELLRAYCARGEVDEAGKIIDYMQENDMAMDADVFSELARGYAVLGEDDRVETVLGSMRNSGFSPDFVTYRGLMAAYAAKGDMERLLKVTDDLPKALQRKGGSLTIFSLYMHTIEVLVINGQENLVPQLMEKVKTMKTERWRAALGRTLAQMIIHGHVNLAFDLYTAVSEEGMNNFRVIELFSRVMRSQKKSSGNIARALALFGIDDSIKYCSDRNLPEVKDILEDMKSKQETTTPLPVSTD